MRTKVKTWLIPLYERIRAELPFFLLITGMIIAAIISLGYAYLHASTKMPVASPVSETQARQFESFDTLEPETPPDTSADNSPSDKPASGHDKTVHPTPSNTLGEQIDCATINSKEGQSVLPFIHKFRKNLNVAKLYKDMQQAYEKYKTDVSAKGCQPTLVLPDLQQLLPL